MGKEQPASYYDRIYATSERYKQHYTKSFYYPLWARIIEICPSGHVTDIGCGVGQFAEMFCDHKDSNYTGIDFSSTAIEMARAKNIPNANFIIMDINEDTPLFSSVVIIGETLEHIKNDLLFLEKIRDRFLIITVPSFDDKSHERYFKTWEEVQKRYGRFFTKQCTIEKVGAWFLMYGQTR